MFDLEEINKQFEAFNFEKLRFNETCKMCKRFYSEHKKELAILQSEYYDIDPEDINASKQYLETHDTLRRFFHIKHLRDIYEEKKDRIGTNTDNVAKDAHIILIYSEDNEPDCFLDLESQDFISVKFPYENYYGKNEEEKIIARNEHRSKIRFIQSLLKQANSYIGEINANNLSLMMNIISDFKTKSNGQKISNREIYDEFNKTINPKKKVNNKILYENIKKLVDQKKKDYEHRRISFEEFKTYGYMIIIIETDDIDSLYQTLNKKEKAFLIDAYIMLSSYKYYYDYNLYYRTSSEMINNQVYLRRHKKKND